MAIDYRKIIGGTVVATKNQESVAWAQACAALDAENILIMVAEKEDGAEYLALPGLAAANDLVFSPLAAAFTSHPQHQGDGIYLHEVPGAIAAVVRAPGRFEALYNTVPAMQAWLSERAQASLAQFDTSKFEAKEFRPLRLRQSQDGREVLGKIATLNFVGAVIALSLAISGAIGVSAFKSATRQDSAAAELKVSELAAQELNRYSTQLFELSRVSTLVVRTGGWIEKYNIKGPLTTYEARVPEWVTADVIKELGAVQTAKDYEKNMVIISRKEPSK